VQAVEYDIATAVIDPNGTVLAFDSGWLAPASRAASTRARA